MRLRIAFVMLVLLCVSCKREAPPVSGVGQWVLAKTKLVDGKLRARCQPSDDLTWCFGAPPIQIGDQPASVDLYFRGHDDDALLAEIALTIRACEVDKADAALRQAMGKPTEEKDKVRIWRNEASFIMARLHTEGIQCLINFVDPKDQERVADLQGGK